MSAKFIITKRNNGDFQFELTARNGQIILSSEGYSVKSACENGIESVRKNSQIDERFIKIESFNKKPYFYLKASNGQTIGNSVMYESEAARDNGIESVKANAVDAVIEYNIEKK